MTRTRREMPDGTLKAVIFDLDGVLVRTDELHYRSWRQVADRHGIPIDRTINERLRGVGRMESLRIILESAGVECTPDERQRLADEKNALYQSMLAQLGPEDVLPGGRELLTNLRAADMRTAVASSSRNGRAILIQVQLLEAVDVIVDGNDITRSKPDPEVFLLAAERLGVPPSTCVVVEDAVAGVEAAHRAGMCAVGIGVSTHPAAPALVVSNVAEIDLQVLASCFNSYAE